MAKITDTRVRLRNIVNGLAEHAETTRRFGRFIAGDLEDRHSDDLSISKRLWYLRHGFRSRRDRHYDFETYSHDEYLKDFSRYSVRQISGSYGSHSKHKLAFYRMLLPEHNDVVPEVYGRIDNNSVYSFGGGRIAEEPTQWLRDLISRNGTIVTKPVGGSSGDNVRVISHVSKVANMSFPNEATDEALMVMKYVEQADYLNDIYSHSANTVRAITIWDYETGDPFVSQAIQRIGVDHSAPADNWSQGGLSAAIDTDTGEIGRVGQLVEGHVEWRESHPNSGAQISGTQIPEWDTIQETLRNLAGTVPQTPLLGWDILVTDDGPMVLEANTIPEPEMMQIHEPMLSNSRSQRFYDDYGAYSH